MPNKRVVNRKEPNRFWIRHSDFKDWLTVIASVAAIIIGIIGIIIGIKYVNTVLIKTTPELGFCPEVSSGSSGGSYQKYLCGDIEKIDANGENNGDLWIKAEIYNKGMVLAVDIEIEVKLIGAKFGLMNNNRTVGIVDYYQDDNKIPSSSLLKNDDVFYLSSVIHTLKPNDVKRILFVFPETFGIYKRPSIIEFTLKENGNIVDKKTIYIEYKNKSRDCKLPIKIISGIVKSDGNPVKSVNLSIKNLQTNDQQSFLTDESGEYLLENFRHCWISGDIVEIKACTDGSCKIEYRKLNTIEDIIEDIIELDIR